MSRLLSRVHLRRPSAGLRIADSLRRRYAAGPCPTMLGRPTPGRPPPAAAATAPPPRGALTSSRHLSSPHTATRSRQPTRPPLLATRAPAEAACLRPPARACSGRRARCGGWGGWRSGCSCLCLSCRASSCSSRSASRRRCGAAAPPQAATSPCGKDEQGLVVADRLAAQWGFQRLHSDEPLLFCQLAGAARALGVYARALWR
jgi:hypothetical protein